LEADVGTECRNGFSQACIAWGTSSKVVYYGGQGIPISFVYDDRIVGDMLAWLLVEVLRACGSQEVL
jgi:hypothetical protein